MGNPTMTFDLARLERFRQARNEARSADQDSFEFDGHPFLVRYADYLIEHLQYRFGGEGSVPLGNMRYQEAAGGSHDA